MDLGKVFIQLDIALLRYFSYDINAFSCFASNQLEIGFGNGEFLLNMASHFKACTFYGIEYQKKFYHKALKWAQIKNLTNVKLFCSEAEATISLLFPDNFFDVVHINFPDPWHKRRHSERRLIDDAFAREVHRILKKNGKLFFATDVEQYFLNAVSILRQNNFESLDWHEYATAQRPFKTKYEKAFLAERKKIFYFLTKKS